MSFLRFLAALVAAFAGVFVGFFEHRAPTPSPSVHIKYVVPAAAISADPLVLAERCEATAGVPIQAGPNLYKCLPNDLVEVLSVFEPLPAATEVEAAQARCHAQGGALVQSLRPNKALCVRDP